MKHLIGKDNVLRTQESYKKTPRYVKQFDATINLWADETDIWWVKGFHQIMNLKKCWQCKVTRVLSNAAEIKTHCWYPNYKMAWRN